MVPMRLPEHGRDGDEVIDELRALQDDDVDFRRGRAFGLVYPGGEELDEVLTAAHDLYLFHNGLNPDAMPSLRRLHADVVAMTVSLLGGDEIDDEPAGFLTSGGTESILMAVKAARNQARAERGLERPNIVMATSAHAAFDKACQYFVVEPRRVDVGPDFRAVPDAMADAVDDGTVLVVASAPQYPQGVIDPVADIAALALDRGVNCHVDACMGGFVLPFLERLGLVSKPCDLRVPGVTSISADIHKYGYTPKGVSAIVYRSKALRAHQTFAFDGWLGGFYASSGVAGAKPGGPMAAAWAALHHLGVEGYCERARAAFDARQRLEAGVRATPGLTVVGDPEVTLLAMASTVPELDVFAVGAALRAKGWLLDRQGPPDSLHATCSPVHRAEVIDELLADLRAAVVDAAGDRLADRTTNYAVLE
jgi:glutamate/tyrosine decarboxylase-like PLP-dependent enzyme